MLDLDFTVFTQADAWIALLTLTALEIVLGIDNIVFISIVSDTLPKGQQAKARSLGLTLALLLRLGLLAAISWVMGLRASLFSVLGNEISGRDLILLGGGLFLIAKATHEIYDKLEIGDGEEAAKEKARTASFAAVIAQILVLDVVFSLDSVITAVGMAKDFIIMAIAVVVAVGVMLIFAGSVSRFVNKHPSMKVLALSFLIMIGVMLVAEGLGQHINKGYIYFAMGFSLLVEMINMRVRGTRPVAA